MTTGVSANRGSLVLFRRGINLDGSSWGPWHPGYIDQTYWVDGDGKFHDEPDLANPTARQAWVSVVPATPEGPSAPTTVPVPLDAEHIDPIVHGSEVLDV